MDSDCLSLPHAFLELRSLTASEVLVVDDKYLKVGLPLLIDRESSTSFPYPASITINKALTEQKWP